MKTINLFAFSVILVILICSGCRSISIRDINPETAPNTRLLPYLVPVVDTQNLQTIYTAGTLSTTGESYSSGAAYGFGHSAGNFANASGFYSGTTTENYDTTFYSDERVSDAVSIFSKEVKQNIIDTSGMSNPRGYITLRLNGRVSDKSILMSVFNIFTFGVLNLVGVPNNYRSEELDIDVSIYNNQKTLIKEYTVIAKDTELRALYYGYTADTASRKAAAWALKSALKDIRGQINRDYNEIISKL